MYDLKAHFYPAREQKDGYLGRVDLTVGDAVRIRGIAVFAKGKSAELLLRFPSFGEPPQSHIYPANKDAYFLMLRLAKAAVANHSYHYSHIPGDLDPDLSIQGQLAEKGPPRGLFSLSIDGFCMLNGITTSADPSSGKEERDIAVQFPNLPSFQDENGQLKSFPIFQGLVAAVYDDSGEKLYDRDYDAYIRKMVQNRHIRLAAQQQVHAANAHESELSVLEPQDKTTPPIVPAR